MRKLSLLFLGLLLIQQLFAADTLRVMHYNILFYGNCIGSCNSSNNNINNKDAWLRTIIEYTEPHIFTVNEICADIPYHDRIKTEVMNDNGRWWYERGPLTNQAGSDIVNQIYYDSRILELHSHYVAQNYVRDINIYRLYYKNASLLKGDTTFLNCIVAHLKAGNDSDDREKRRIQTLNLMNYLEDNAFIGNNLFMGDFNVYTSSEPGFQNLVNFSNPDVRFYDPINRLGQWHNSSSYADIHTQSTHTDQDCHVPGGMDDRFDFIMISEGIKFNQYDISYIQGTYKAVGQDGQRFNKALTDPPSNNSVPSNVLNALFGMSDHLPVILDLKIDVLGDIYESPVTIGNAIKCNNPVTDILTINLSNVDAISMEIIDASGSAVYGESILSDQLTIDVSGMAKGIYLLQFKLADDRLAVKKLVIN